MNSCLRADTSRTLEDFPGDGSLSSDDWIQRFELARDIGAWSDGKTRAVLLAKLTGDVRRWHLNTGIHYATYDEWKTRFLEKCPRSTLARFVTEPEFRAQAKHESLDEFVWTMTTIASETVVHPDDLKEHILVGVQRLSPAAARKLHRKVHRDVSHLLKDIKDCQPVTYPYETSYWWSTASNGEVPKNAFVAGTNRDGENFYIGRAMHNGIGVPGKVVPSRRTCSILWNGETYCYKNYEIFCVDTPSEVKWTLAEKDKSPPGVIWTGSAGQWYCIARGKSMDIVGTPHPLGQENNSTDDDDTYEMLTVRALQLAWPTPCVLPNLSSPRKTAVAAAVAFGHNAGPDTTDESEDTDGSAGTDELEESDSSA